jgi:hypothetical protein
MFVVDQNSAKQVQGDIQELLDALASLLDRLKTEKSKTETSSIPNVAVEQEWEHREPEQPTSQSLLEGRERLPQLEGFDPQRLVGREPLSELSGIDIPPQLEGRERLPQLEGFTPALLEGQAVTSPPLLADATASADKTGENLTSVENLAQNSDPIENLTPVENPAQFEHTLQIQMGEIQIAGTLTEVETELQQLAPEQRTILNEAIHQPAGTAGTEVAVSIAVDDVPVLHRNEQGQMLVNEIPTATAVVDPQTDISYDEQTPSTRLPNDLTHWQTVEAQATAVERIADPEPQPHLEVRPVAEVESLTGEQLSDSSSIHDLVVQQAPSVVVAVDDEGKVKPGSYLRDQVEATEDEIESGIQTEHNQTQMLTPEAIAVVEALKDHFEQTGDSFVVGQEYLFQDQPNGIVIIPHDQQQTPISITNHCVDPAIDPVQYEQLMQRFSSTYERIQVAQGQEGYEQDYEVG